MFQGHAEQLTIYGLAYLTELHEGQDPRFTGYQTCQVAELASRCAGGVFFV
jgi:hypothetical protein